MKTKYLFLGNEGSVSEAAGFSNSYKKALEKNLHDIIDDSDDNLYTLDTPDGSKVRR